MGKLDHSNKPANVSMSYTLESLKTFVRIQKIDSLTADVWSPFVRQDLRPIELSEKGQERFIQFFQLLKKEFRLNGFYQIESANNFPSDCGLASSASSFAALTRCAHEAYRQDTRLAVYTAKELSKLSQKGSGSSCRSFFSPWGLWHEHGAEEIKLEMTQLKHMVILCDESTKPVSSSDAHQKVLTSDLFKGRPERASVRFQELVSLLRKKNWQECWKNIFEICWNEFWDMHVLFHTAKPPFMYMNAESQYALSNILHFWKEANDGPLVTMDAGSNVHLLFRDDQTSMYDQYVKHFVKTFSIWAHNVYQPQS